MREKREEHAVEAHYRDTDIEQIQAGQYRMFPYEVETLDDSPPCNASVTTLRLAGRPDHKRCQHRYAGDDASD